MEYLLGRFTDSLDHTQQSLDLFKTSGNNTDLRKIYHLLGMVFLRLGNYDPAAIHITLSLELATASADDSALAASYSALGTLYDMRGQFTEAVASYEKALGLYQILGNRSAMALTLNNLGNTYLGLGELDKAKSFFTQGLALARKIHLDVIIPYFLYNLAVIAKRTSDYEAGLAQCLEALKLSRANGDKSLKGQHLGYVGCICNQP